MLEDIINHLHIVSIFLIGHVRNCQLDLVSKRRSLCRLSRVPSLDLSEISVIGIVLDIF